MPKRLKHNNFESESPFFQALKELHAFQFLVWLAKINNPALTLKELGEKYQISEQTAFKYVHLVDDKVKPILIDRADEGLQRLIPLWLTMVERRLEEGSDWVITEFGKGLGLFRQKFEIEDKRSPEEFKANLVANTSRLLGSRVDMTEAILTTEAVIDLQNGKEQVKADDSETIEGKNEKNEITDTLKKDCPESLLGGK